MKTPTRTLVAAALVGGLVLGLARPALGQPAPPLQGVTKQRTRAWSAAELGFQGTVIADGVFFLGPVVTVQGGHFRPLVGVFQLGAGVALYKDPIPDPMYAPTDPEANPTEQSAMFYLGLGARVRIFQFLRALRDRRFDLYVGPLAMLFGNHDLVTFGIGGEVGFAVHLGRLRLSLTAHGGYQSVLHQYADAAATQYKFRASYLVGGQIAVGAHF